MEGSPPSPRPPLQPDLDEMGGMSETQCRHLEPWGGCEACTKHGRTEQSAPLLVDSVLACSKKHGRRSWPKWARPSPPALDNVREALSGMLQA